MTEDLNTVQRAIIEMGGYNAVSRAMGHNRGHHLRAIAEGKHVPSARTRAKIVQLSAGRLTDGDIIGITGRTERDTRPAGPNVDSHWENDEDVRRAWIIRRAADAARAQRLANEATA